MLKKILVGILGIIVLGGAGFALYQNTQSASAKETERQYGQNIAETGRIEDGYEYGRKDNQSNGKTHGDTTGHAGRNSEMAETGCATGAFSSDLSELDETEAEGLTYMREEEKLARDVYLTLYDVWGLPVFQNIAGSEQSHMDAILNLMNAYDMEDPASTQAGIFTNPDLQALYDQLVEQGSQSIAEALKVGGAIEEIDILDLQKYIAETDNVDIQQVFNNLLSGSENHLRAFTNNYRAQTGESYQPQYMSAEAYQAIVNASMGNGGNGNKDMQGGNGNAGKGNTTKGSSSSSRGNRGNNASHGYESED